MTSGGALTGDPAAGAGSNPLNTKVTGAVGSALFTWLRSAKRLALRLTVSARVTVPEMRTLPSVVTIRSMPPRMALPEA